MNNPKQMRRLRVVALLAGSSLLAAMNSLPAVAAEGEVDVVNTETVQVYTDATGEVDTKRLYEQLALTSEGSVQVVNPVESDGLRNLDGFGGFDVENGEQRVDVTVDGEKNLRTVSNYQGELPVEIAVSYELDGEPIEPADLVGRSGDLEVRYTVRNVSGQTRTLSFDDGRGGTVEKDVEVMMPMVGSLTTTLPGSFRDVTSQEANMAGDGKGGTKLSFTMTLLAPLGSDTAEFGYTARIVDAVVPDAQASLLPVNPLESPSFKSAGASYQAGAATGAELADGATTIDANLLKLRDGAGELLAGLIKLRDGSDRLSEGLVDEAAPGSRRLADGAADLEDGLGRLDEGAGQLADGSGRLARGTGDALEGSKDLTAGLGQISDGLDTMAGKLPQARDGITQLKDGVDAILAGLGDPNNPKTLIGGLVALDNGVSAVQDGITARLIPGVDEVKGGVLQVKAGLDDAIKPGGSVDQLIGGLQSLARLPGCAADVDPICAGTVQQLLAGAQSSKTNLQLAAGGLGQVTAGIDTRLLPGIIGLRDDSTAGLGALHAGVASLLGGAGRLQDGAQRIRVGLDALDTGIADAVAGTLRLANGAQDAEAGSSRLSNGLGELSAGADDLEAGAGRLADGTGEAAAGSVELEAGAQRLADGLGAAASGSGELAEGLGQAVGAAPRLRDGAQQLSEEGTSRLVEAGESTAQQYGEMYAMLETGAQMAEDENMVVGAPEGAVGLAAYSFEIQGQNGEGGRNLSRGLIGLGVLAAGAGVLALRRRLV